MKRLTQKKIVIKYLENKNFLVYYLTGLRLLDERDFREAWRWSKKQCVSFLENINTKCDCDMCPWCFYVRSCILDDFIYHCGRCRFGKRHGYCIGEWGEQKNLYHQIVDEKLKKAFVQIEDFCTLVGEAKNAYNYYIKNKI